MGERKKGKDSFLDIWKDKHRERKERGKREEDKELVKERRTKR